MDDAAVTKPQSRSNKKKRSEENDKEEEDAEAEEEVCDDEAWETLSQSFRQVQAVLDQNRTLINQVNENHQSRIPDNLTRNVNLIREINGNISKVLSIYSDLSANFSNIVHGRRSIEAPKNDGVNAAPKKAS